MTNLSIEIRLGNKGQAMVEMAFVLFFLVVLIFGMTEFGRAMYTKNTLTNAARAGVRAEVVTSGITSVSLSKGSLSTDCTSYSCPNPTNPEQCVYQAVCNSIVTDSLKSLVSISASGVPAIAGNTVTVTVQADFSSVVPRLFGPSGLIPFPISLTGTASMRQEQ